MAHWLYRHVFRGIGILLAAGMITFLVLAVRSQMHHAQAGPQSGAQAPR